MWDEPMFTNIHEPEDIKRVIGRMKDISIQVGRKEGMKVLIIGMPNTGKSSMLNVIRRHATDRKCTSHSNHLVDCRECRQNVKSGRPDERSLQCHKGN
jgi:ribosome biogenesis GTPase A